MARVYVINRSSHDFSGAEKYGKLVFLSEGKVDKFQTNNIFRQFYHYLRNADASDFLLCTGLTIMNIIATSILIRRFGKVNLLIYNDKNRTYSERLLDLSNIT